MSFELNLDYLHTNTCGQIFAVEAIFGLLGGIINIFSIGRATGLLAFTFWTTLFISGNIVLLTICNVYEKIHAKLGNLLVQLEQCYIGLWIIFYGIATILTFIGWGLSALVAYIELMLFIVNAYFHYKSPRFSPETSENIPAEQIEWLSYMN